MGPKQSSTENVSKRQLTINHPMFSLAEYVEGQDQSFIRTQVHMANKQQFDEWHKRIQNIPQNDSLMQPINAQYKTEGLCGNSGVAFITYSDYPYLLSDEIQNRKSMSIKLFEENQLWYLIYTILSAASVYHQQGVKTGDIRPDNIFINQNGQVKVASVDSWPGEQTNYAKSFFQKQVTYLSPEEVKDYQFGKIQESADKQLAETFSIGLTALDAATLSESKSLYSKNFKFQYEKLQSKLSEFQKEAYSELLTLTVQSMCEVDAEYRPTTRQILSWLSPHQDAIVNLEDFQLQEVPEKLKIIKERNQKTNPPSLPTIQNTTQYSYPLSTYTPTPLPTTYTPTQLPAIYTQSQLPTNYNQQTNFSQPITFSLNNPSIPSYPPNIQIPSYQVTSTYSQSYQASSYNPPQHFEISSNYQGSGQPPTLTSGFSNPIVETHKFTLSKIDQQLQLSRKMFPQ